MSTSNPLTQTVNETAGGYAAGKENSVDKASVEVDIVEQKLAEDAEKEDFTGIDSAHSGQLLKMSMTINANEGFMLLLAEYNNLYYQSKVISWLDQKLVEQSVLDCEDIPDYAEVEEQLFLLAREHEVIHITGTHRWFSKNATENWADRLNYRRERIAENAPVAIVLWLFGAQITELANKATDFWSWRTSIFEFNSVAQPKGMEVKFDELQASNIQDGIKQKRIHEIDSYLHHCDTLSLSDSDLIFEKAELLQLLERPKEAISELQKAYAVVDKSDDVRRKGLLDLLYAEVLYDLELYGEVNSLLETSVIPTFSSLMDVFFLARAKALKARSIRYNDIKHETDRVHESIKLLNNEVLPIFEQLGKWGKVEQCLHTLAENYYNLGEYEKLDELIEQKWLPQLEKNGYSYFSYTSHMFRAVLFINKGEFEKAKDELQLIVFPNLDLYPNNYNAAQAYGVYADLFAKEGNITRSLDIYKSKVIPAYKKCKSIRNLVFSTLKMVEIIISQDLSTSKKPKKKSLKKAAKLLNELHRYVHNLKENIEFQAQIEDAADEYGIKLYLRQGK